MKPDYAAHFTEGVSHFNSREFWHAHESWEMIWLEAESDVVEFLQGLIQIAAAYHHVQRGTFRGAGRLFDAGLGRLEPFPLVFSGIDRGAVDTAARRHRAWVVSLLERGATDERLGAADYPQLLLVGSGASKMPPFDEW
jgi:hypothetical protein